MVGLGKIGLPLAVQYASKGATVIGCDINQEVVEAVNSGISPIEREAGLSERLAECVDSGRLRATNDTSSATSESDVIVTIVPVGLTDYKAPISRL